MATRPMVKRMTNAELLCRQRPFMDAFCGCEDCALEAKEQSSLALEVMDCGIAVGRTPAGLHFSGNGMPGADQTEVDSDNSGDFSYMAGCLE